MSENFNDILAEIKKIKSGVPVFIPSLQQTIELKPLTLSQQKMIIESSVDTNLSVLFFNTTFYSILEQNVSQKMSTFDTIDRVTLALALRQQLQDTATVDDQDVLISAIIDANKSKTFAEKSKTIDTPNFKFTVKVPTLDFDNKINSILLRKYKDENIKTNKLKTLISDMFSYEIYKFIDTVELQSNGKIIDLRSNTVEGLKLIESLDSKEFVDVVKFINTVRDIEKELTRVPNTASHINILPDFFIV